MDNHTLLQQFRYILSLASLAYTFTALHTIQYYTMANSNRRSATTQPTPPDPSHPTNPSASASSSGSQATPATTSAPINQEKNNGRWTDEEIKLLLDYVSANCALTTARGLSLKKTAFSQAHAIVKTKDASQCHYKWGNVRIIIIHDSFYRLS